MTYNIKYSETKTNYFVYLKPFQYRFKLHTLAGIQNGNSEHA